MSSHLNDCNGHRFGSSNSNTHDFPASALVTFSLLNTAAVVILLVRYKSDYATLSPPVASHLTQGKVETPHNGS